MKDDDKRMDGVELAAATGLGTWGIYGIKKANKLFFKQGIDKALIFSGRYSTPAKITAWMDEHPNFVANQVLDPKRKKKDKDAATPDAATAPADAARPPRPQRRAA